MKVSWNLNRLRQALFALVLPMTFGCAIDDEVMGGFDLDCELDSVSTGPCRVRESGAAVTLSLGNDITSWSHEGGGQLVAPIPTGFYNEHYVIFEDPNLVAGNITDGVTIFGVTGTVAGSVAACVLNGLQSDECRAGIGSYWTNIEGTSDLGADGNLVVSIPQGYHDGSTTATAQDSDLIAGNIRDGVNVFGVTGNLVEAFGACTDDAINTGQCSTQANRYVTATLGGSPSGSDGSLSISIPLGFYSGSTNATAQDSDLIAGNIRDGVNVFGVTGNLVEAFGACTDDAINAGQCSTQANRFVTATLGGSPSGSDGSLSIPIPLGFYSGSTTATAQDSDLIAGNIRDGVNVFGVTGNLVEAFGACTDDAINTGQCSTQANRYVTATLGGSPSGSDGSLSISIPLGFYSGSTNATAQDSDLIAGNIRDGVNIFGVAGNLVEAFGACTDNTLNAAQCSTASGRYVYVNEYGGRTNICSVGLNSDPCWTNASARFMAEGSGGHVTVSGGLTATIPLAYYGGTTQCQVSDANLLAGNIRDGVEILGVLGNYTGGGGGGTIDQASTMHRDVGASQITLEEETTTYAGTNALPAGYRPVPSILESDDGDHSSSPVVKVNRTGWGTNTCGLSGSIEDRIDDCAAHGTLGSGATWDGEVNGNAGEGVWRLVTRTGNIDSSRGREVWRDERTKLLWSSRVASSLNWCKASGSNGISGNPFAEVDPSGYCDNATYQNTVGDAISACYEGPGFTDSDASSIFPTGKGDLDLGSTPAVAWRLPTIYDFQQANINGLRFVMPDALGSEWSASVRSDNRAHARIFLSSNGNVGTNIRPNNNAVRCVGR